MCLTDSVITYLIVPLFNTDCVNVKLFVMDWLYKKKSAGPSIGDPNILSLYLSETSNSIAIFNATNLDSKLENSTVFFRFGNQIINEFPR